MLGGTRPVHVVGQDLPEQSLAAFGWEFLACWLQQS